MNNARRDWLIGPYPIATGTFFTVVGLLEVITFEAKFLSSVGLVAGVTLLIAGCLRRVRSRREHPSETPPAE